MHSKFWQLINGEHLEAIPSAFAKGRGNETRRLLSQHEWLLRRKSDGRFLATYSDDQFQLLVRDAKTRHACEKFLSRERFSSAESLKSVQAMLSELTISKQYGEQHQLSLVPEPTSLAFAGFDRYQRPLWMQWDAAIAWKKMQHAARQDMVALEAISGYRGHAYQLGIFKRKLARGLSLEQILEVNAAPGYSEHHSGRAIDIGTPGEAPAEESFENTSAFAWLIQYAQHFGFRLSYPRNNVHGIIYEPWHWYFNQ
jgi:zinc D-Ala-D-Ala carboxypeptidase